MIIVGVSDDCYYGSGISVNDRQKITNNRSWTHVNFGIEKG